MTPSVCIRVYVCVLQECRPGYDPAYMAKQPHINARMRAILVDWLVEVHYKFKCCPETLYLTVNLIDRFLDRKQVPRPKLQLVGVTAFLVRGVDAWRVGRCLSVLCGRAWLDVWLAGWMDGCACVCVGVPVLLGLISTMYICTCVHPYMRVLHR